MDYDKQIEKYSNAIVRLRELKQKNSINNCPDIIGKYFRPAVNSFYKITSIDYCHNDEYNTIDVGCINIYLDLKMKKASIKSDSDGTIQLSQECSKEEFNKSFTEAMQIITSQL